jgi:small subunit ribosomal protein S1
MVQEGVDSQQLSTLIEADYDYSRLDRGQVCPATILSVGENEVIVDLGSKRDGIVQRKDLELLDDAYRGGLEVGDQVPVCVLAVSDDEGNLVVSLNLGLTRRDWLQAQGFLESEEICEAEVTDVNRGGVIVPFGRLRGFVPNSQLTLFRRGMHGDRLRQAKRDLVGQTISLMVIEVDQRQRRLVLSQRVADWHRSQQLLEESTEGNVVTGTVSNLTEFGAFVDLGGLDGLIHISELDWKHVAHPSEVLSVGDEIEAYVLKVDRRRGRVGLSRKRLLPDPWPIVAQDLYARQCVAGVVRGVVEFGVFVDLGEGVEGLVHTSQIPGGREGRADLEPGTSVTVRVLEVDRRRRRISLSLKDVTNAPYALGEKQFA